MQTLVEQIVINILIQQMRIGPDRIWIQDQTRKIPEDDGLFIQVGSFPDQCIGNVTYQQDETVNDITIVHEINQVMARELIQIDICSRSNEAIFRRWDPVLAMQSIYSQQQQELNNFKIFRMAKPIKTSGAEGGSNINRYSISVPCIVWYKLDNIETSPLGDYFNDFTTRVDDPATIGGNAPVADFEINADSPPPP